jgi:NAD-dependent deacetylase
MSLADVRAQIETNGRSPCCACGGLVKAAVVSFGERLPEHVLERAWELAASSDLFLAVGSSLQVQPVAQLPLVAKRSGTRFAIVNRDATALDDAADLLVRASIGSVFVALYPQLVN